MTDAATFDFVAPLTVCIDFRSPQSYLALAPTCELITRLNVAVDWVPRLIDSAPTKDPVARDAQSRGARHRRWRAEYAALDLARYGGALGIGESNPSACGRGVIAALGLLRVREACADRSTDYVAAMFDSVWRQQRSIDDAATVARLLADLGAGPITASEDTLTELDTRLQAAGALNVPTYFVDEEPFLGRAHLPMIEWLLGGRQGPGPI